LLWAKDDLLLKARQYLRRAHSLDRSSELFLFWASLRSGTPRKRRGAAHLYTVLLADPQQDDSILHVFGHATSNTPKLRSISFAAVVKRCKAVIPTFTETEHAFALRMAEWRSAELHSGNIPV
jgi:hypothetical protein